MFAPLIAAGARTAAGGIRNAGKITTNTARRSKPRRERVRKRYARQNPIYSHNLASAKRVAKYLAKSRRVWRAFWLSAGVIGFIYSLQIFFAYLSLIGTLTMFGIDGASLLSFLDNLTFDLAGSSAVGLFLLGGALAMLSGMISASITMVVFLIHRLDPLPSTCLLSLVVLLAVMFFSPINFLPIMYLWLGHVTWANFKA